MAIDVLSLLSGESRTQQQQAFVIEDAVDAADVAAYHAIRRDVFVAEQGIFAGSDRDDRDDDARSIVLVARLPDGTVAGGVRLAPVDGGPDIGWWAGSRLAVQRNARGLGAVGPALVRAACAKAEAVGVLRFDATVQEGRQRMFRWLGWEDLGAVTVAGRPHHLMQWPITRIERLVRDTKSVIGTTLAGLRPGGPGFAGDDAAPVPGSDLVVTCDGVMPSIVERDPTWAGWCAVLVNVNDLAAMGAEPVGLLDTIAGPTPSHLARVMAGIRAATDAYGVPLLGGHTQVGCRPSVSVTGLGRAATPIRAGGGQPGHAITLTVDLGGRWRPGYTGAQWDSTSSRSADELAGMVSAVRRAQPAAAKDVSMAGIAGTLAAMAEASGCGAELEMAAVPRPPSVSPGDWLTCFPGFGMLTADSPGGPGLDGGPATSAACGRLVAGQGLALVWPDGRRTSAVAGPVTGLSAA